MIMAAILFTQLPVSKEAAEKFKPLGLAPNRSGGAIHGPQCDFSI
jgi:hypothetical protein